MELIKQAVTLLEGPTPSTVEDIVKALNKELKGKPVTAFGKNDKGLWGKSDEPQTYTIAKITSTYHRKEEAEAGGDVFVSLDLYLTKYKADKFGLIYTSKNFMKSLTPLVKATSVAKMIKEFDYSEQGMQGDNFVNLDATFKLPKPIQKQVKEQAVAEDIHKDIKKLLDAGTKVVSKAVGRVGEITKVDGDSVYIKLQTKRSGVTSFARDKGDKVRLEKQADGSYHVVNTAWDKLDKAK